MSFYRTRQTSLAGLFGPNWRFIDPRPRRIARNTFEQRWENGKRCVWFHRTPIIRQNPLEGLWLTSDGYRTLSTKDRLNRFQTRVRIWSKRGVWQFRDLLTGAEGQFEDVMFFPAAAPPHDFAPWLSALEDRSQ